MADTPTIATSVPQPEFSDAGVLLPDEADILNGVITDDNAAFGNALSYYNADGTLAQSRACTQMAITKAAVINYAFGFLAYLANSFDPAVASGRMQDAIASINFLTRKTANFTSVTCTLTGATGTRIPAGTQAQDTAGNTYTNAGTVTIGSSGTVQATFNCTTAGPIECPAGTLTIISQIIPGWDSITNPSDGIVGNLVESRADFEERRQQSVAFPGTGSNGAILASVKAVPGVIDAYVADNKTQVTVTIGGVSVAAHGVLVAVAGGTDAEVATAIFKKIAGGTPLAGDTTVTVEDDMNGYVAPYPTTPITFQRAKATPIYVRVTLTASNAIPSTADDSIAAACVRAFEGAGVAATSMKRINTTVYGSDFVDDVRALGSWARIVSIQVSLDGTTYSDTVALNATQIPTLVADNVSTVTASLSTPS